MTGLSVLAGALCGIAVLVLPDRPRVALRAAGATAPRGRARPRGGAPGAEPAAGVTVEDVLAVLELVATQVRAGASPLRAWYAAVDVVGLRSAGAAPLDWLDAVATCTGATPADKPSAAAAAAGAGAAWRLAERTGAPLADVLDGVAAAVRDDLAVAGEISVALAGPRATVRLLTVLPLFGLLLGQLIGARPVAVLVGTPTGRVCAVLGMVLLLAGRRWMRHLVARVAVA